MASAQRGLLRSLQLRALIERMCSSIRWLAQTLTATPHYLSLSELQKAYLFCTSYMHCLYWVMLVCSWSATPLCATRWSACSVNWGNPDPARTQQPTDCAVSPANPWLLVKLHRLMMSTTSPAQFSWIWSRGWFTPSSTRLTQTCTTQRTSTSLSMVEVLAITGLVDTHRWSLEMTCFFL